ncbi:MAG: two-component regulator propeller domain-containing protein [Pseudomonadota bacterium]
MTRSPTSSSSLPKRFGQVLVGVVLGALLLCTTASSTAAVGEPAAEKQRNLRLTTHPLPVSFEHQAIRRVLQDQEGFLWFATPRGLLRFDGDHHRVYDRSSAPGWGPGDEDIRDIILSDSGELWIATASGVDRFDPTTQSFRPLELARDGVTLETGATRLLLDREQNLWVALDSGGLLRVATQPETASAAPAAAAYFAPGEGSLPAATVTALLEDRVGNLWVGTAIGLLRYNRRDQRFMPFDPEPEQPLAVTDFHEDGSGHLWIGTDGQGLWRFDGDRQSFMVWAHSPEDPATLGSNRIQAVLADHAGSLWVATDQGLNEVLGAAEVRRYEADPTLPWNLRDGLVLSLFEDRQQVLWVGTGSGLARWNYLSDTFNYFDGFLAQSDVLAVTERSNGEIWLALRGRGLLRMHRMTGRVEPLEALNARLPDDRITSLKADPTGHLWIGYRRSGLVRLDAATAEPRRIADRNGALDYPVAALDLDRSHLATEPRLWVAVRDVGLSSLPLGPLAEAAPAALDAPRDLGGEVDLRVLLSGAPGDLWLGTSDGRVGLLDPETGSVSWRRLAGDAASTVVTLWETASGDLWIGTRASGLFQLPAGQPLDDPAALRRFTRRDGLVSNRINAILEDEAGALWLASDRGLSHFQPETHESRRYGQRQGLRDERFRPRAALHTRSGELLFGSRRGLVAFFPYSNRLQTDEPPDLAAAAWHGGRFLGQAVTTVAAEPGLLSLSPEQRRIDFRFSALDTRQLDQVHFQYQLRGFDAEWIDAGLDRNATYTNLAPGYYEFVVRAAHRSAPLEFRALSLPLSVATPLWQTRPALIGYAIAGTVLLLWWWISLHNSRRRVRLAQRNLEIEVEARTIELEERNQQLQELNGRLQEASITDPLTGLLNRRSFYEFVGRAVARIERDYTGNEPGEPRPDQGRLLFFMMIDLDEFKPINDTFGHHTGDHTLVQVSDLLRACAREADTVFRWGGDEFLIVGEVRDRNDMTLLAERIRLTIAEHRFDPKYGKALRLSASIGAAAYPFCFENPGVASWEQVADIADLAALLAKTHGKNAWVTTHGTADLTATQVQRIKNNFELLIESGRIIAVTSDMDVPLRGAFRSG